MEKTNPKNLKRRDFIKTTAAGVGAAMIAPTILTSCSNWKGANSRINIGHIGVGSRGSAELKYYFMPLKSSYQVAVSDVWQDRRDNWTKQINDYYKKNGIKAPECKSYLNFVEILERDDIDAVHITTPDHWHVPAAIKAARAGKHIMLAKPLGLSYPNYLILQKELEKNQVHFHYGTQQRSMRHLKLGVNMIKDGLIGDIERVQVWAPGKNPVPNPVCNESPIPKEFDYDRWTGPARLNTFCPDRVTNNSSWFQYDYSIGFLAGWGAHPLDIMVWALKDKVDGVYSCEGTGKFWPKGGIYNNILSWDLNYKYKNGLELHFVSDDVAKNGLLDHLRLKASNGTTFYGTKGWISLSRTSAESNIPELDKKLNDFPKNADGRIRSEGNIMGQMFVDVITGKIKETCPLSEAIISDTISHMGDIAIRTNRKVTWNPQIGEVINDPEANSLYVRKMREPYAV